MATKRNPRTRLAEKVSLLIVEATKLGFDTKAELNAENEGKVEWRRREGGEKVK